MNVDRYDPQAVEGDTSASNPYLTKRDVKLIGLILVGLGVVLYPVYKYGVRQSEQSRCSANLHAISEALNQYAELKDDRFPPLYRTGADNEPGLGTTGLPYTWCDDVAPLMNKRYSFICPSALPDEAVVTEDPDSMSRVLKTTYGMYAPYGAYPRSLIAAPDETALIAETSNLGSDGSYDPLPFKDSGGHSLPDGFVIGWSNSNEAPNEKTKSVTRLAYRDTSTGIFKSDGVSRHDTGIHIMTVTGERKRLPPTAALVQRSFDSITGLWAMPVVHRNP